MYEFTMEAAEGAAGVFEALTDQVAPVLAAQQAQGDLLFDPVGPAPEPGDLAEVATVPASGVMLTPDGHPHVAVPFGPVRWEPTQAWWGVIGVLHVPAGSTVTVLHEDPGPDGHLPLYLAPGEYEVIRQRQWMPATSPLRSRGAQPRVSMSREQQAQVAAAEQYRGSLVGGRFAGPTPTFMGLPISDVESC